MVGHFKPTMILPKHSLENDKRHFEGELSIPNFENFGSILILTIHFYA